MYNIFKQTVPAWGAFNAGTNSLNLTITTLGILPIFQAPAGDNNTMKMVINHFIALTDRLTY